MSKIEIVNSYNRTNTADIEKDNEFYRRLSFINKDILDGEAYYNQSYEGYGDLLILPDGYFPLFSEYFDTLYIADYSNVLYKLSYYPGLKRDSEEMNETSVITRIPKNKVYLEREYILERSSFLTEDKYGDENKNQLLTALEKIKDGVYSSFTNREHGRENLKQIPPEEINQLMRQILCKYGIIDKNTIAKESDIRELFVRYIKNKVKDERKKNNVLTLTELLTNVY